MAEVCLICGSSNCAFFVKSRAQMHSSREEFDFSRCGDCGYVFIDPPVEKRELANYYTEHYLPYRGASAWGKFAPMVEKSDRKLNQKRAEWAFAGRTAKAETLVLDIGCGKPDFLRECVERFGCRGVGVDFSDEGWRDSSAFDKLQLNVGEVSDLPDDLRPDIITMWHYLEHDYAPHETLQKLAAHAKNETMLVIEVPDFDSAGRRKFGGNWAGFHTPRHFSVFSEKNLRILLEKNGWEVSRIDRFGTLDPYVLDWMSRMEKNGIAWEKSMEGEFWRFVAGMIAFWPTKLREKTKPLGLMTAFATPKR